jgi:DNA-binding protein HU-beta
MRSEQFSSAALARRSGNVRGTERLRSRRPSASGASRFRAGVSEQRGIGSGARIGKSGILPRDARGASSGSTGKSRAHAIFYACASVRRIEYAIVSTRRNAGDSNNEEGVVKMAKDGKALSKSQTADHLAKSTGTTKKQATQFLDDLTALAYKEAKNSFTIPGVGKLVLVNRKARMGRNPATGEEIKIPAKRVVKFRVSKKAKDAILGPKK